MSDPIWAILLLKDFGAAKQRLSSALSPVERAALARENAALALRAAAPADRILAVCGSPAAAELAEAYGADVLIEANPEGQNAAAIRGIDAARAGGAGAILLLSADLPLITSDAVRGLLVRARSLGSSSVLAAAAIGRGGTNALYMCPPGIIGRHFGDDSLGKFERDAAKRAIRFEIYEAEELGLDLDEPQDLETLAEAR